MIQETSTESWSGRDQLGHEVIDGPDYGSQGTLRRVATVRGSGCGVGVVRDGGERDPEKAGGFAAARRTDAADEREIRGDDRCGSYEGGADGGSGERDGSADFDVPGCDGTR